MKLTAQFLLIGTIATGSIPHAAKPGVSLDGYRFEFPCKGAMPENPKKGAGCQSALVKGAPFKGPEVAKVTIAEFSDFQ